jgi:Zn-dependent M28 family amino/carboxypeptidase
LLGAKYYAEHPLYPLTKTLADINIDGTSVWGKTRDIEDISDGNSDLDDMLGEATKHQGRVMVPNSKPERGSFYRADNFEFSKVGIPSLYTGRGRDFPDKPPGFGEQKVEEYVAKHYHQPSDQVDSGWDLSGAVQDAQLLFRWAPSATLRNGLSKTYAWINAQVQGQTGPAVAAASASE